MPAALIVSSEPPLFPALEHLLAEEGIEARTIREDLSHRRPRLLHPAVIILNTTSGPDRREELIRDLRERFPSLPVIELRPDFEALRASPADATVTEPFSIPELKSVIDRLARDG